MSDSLPAPQVLEKECSENDYIKYANVNIIQKYSEWGREGGKEEERERIQFRGI